MFHADILVTRTKVCLEELEFFVTYDTFSGYFLSIGVNFK